MTGRTRLTVMAGLASVLGAVVLRPLFTTLDYLLPVIGAVAVVAATSEICRRLALPAVLAPLLSLVTLAGYLVAVFAHRHAFLGVIPGADAQADLRALVRTGFKDVANLAPPVPLHRGLLLLTTAGVGVVAVLIDFIAVGLRKAAVAGLPLFGLFVVPAAVAPKGIGALAFVVAASGYLALLVADGRERLGRWGKPLGVGRRPSEGPALHADVAETSPLARVGRRIAAASLGLAVVVPSALPGIDDRPFGAGGGGTGAGNGSSSVTAINPITQLRRQLTSKVNTKVLRYTSDGASNGYLRMTTLDNFDGLQWSQRELKASSDQRVSHGLPAPLGLDPTVETRTVALQVKVEKGFRVPWLPLPYPATKVDVKGDWRYEDSTRTVFSSRTSTQGISYRASGLVPLPSPDQLRGARPSTVDAAYTRLPPLPGEIVALTEKVTRAGKTDYDKAVLLQAFFQSSFRYSTDVQDGNGTDALLRFLLQDRRGYCEQFASSMAAMARLIGIPARVDIGFTPGVRDGSSQLVTIHDAHAWPELWFEGVGWLPFEPTPRSDGQVTLPAYSVKAAPNPGKPTPSATPSAQPSTSATHIPKSNLEHIAPERRGTTTGRGASGALRLVLLVVLLVSALLATPSVARRVARRRRWAAAETPASAAHAAWAELHATVDDLGLEWRRSDTPRATARRLGADLDEEPSAALRRVGAAEERARYAKWTEDAGGPGDAELRADLELIARGLRATASRRDRWRAALLPRSVLAAAFHATTGLVADVLDGVDLIIATASRGIRRAVSPLARG